ncbi:sulfur reduction protein DsrE [Olleya sp. AS48]|uniref:sulfur reduction protein DsrE n=1 Tax=Olleya sp. AS48 TaxID=3135774 RepID=UPI00317BFDA4
MKNSILIFTTLFSFICGTQQLQAQDFNTTKNNYLILSKNIPQLKPVLLTAQSLATEDGINYGDFYVIICGKTVKDIPNNTEFKTLLEEAKFLNIKVFVCGISLKKFNITPKQLPDSIVVTENGILYGFQLTKNGFLTLTI